MHRLLLTIVTFLCASSAHDVTFLSDFVPEHPLADNSTFGNIEQITTTHFHLDWSIDFDTRVISGTITHDLEVVADTRVLQMDAWDINVYGVK